MRLIKEMKIEVTSEISELTASGAPDGAPEVTHESTGAFLHLLDEGMLITYTSEGESGESSSTDIEIKGGAVTVKRRGAVECDFVFEEGVTHATLYKVGAYSFDTEVTARKIRQGIGEDGGRLDLYYGMSIGGADKSVRMKIELLPIK